MVTSANRTNPFPGLRPFELDEEHLFFGREGQSDELLVRLNRTRFLGVVGTSGSGKSSLVRAGLLPSLYSGFLQDASSNWRISLLRPGNSPIRNLAEALNDPDVFGVKPTSDDAIIRVALTESTLRRGSLGLVEVTQQARMAPYENLLVVVDQFEELFRFKDQARAAGNFLEAEDEAAAFVKLLLSAINQRDLPIFVVLTMRSDFLGDCSQFRDLPETLNESQYLIPRLTRDQLRRAIEGPVAVGGAQIARKLVNRLLNDMGDNPDQLPIMQHALMRTWDYWEDQQTPDLPIDIPHYEAIGGMEKALSLHADQVYAALPSDRGREITEVLFKCLTDRGADNREIRRPTQLGEVCDVADASLDEVVNVIDAFRAPRRSFLMPPVGTALLASSVIDISHESLMRNWQRLKDWVTEEAQSANTYRRLAETTALHEREEAGYLRDPELTLGLLWREKQHPTAAWADRYAPNFAEVMQFLEDSAAAKAAEQAEQEKKRRQQVNRYRLFIGCLAVLSGLAIAAASYAKLQQQEAQAQAAIALEQEEKARTQQQIAEAEKQRAEDAKRAADQARNEAESATGRALQEEAKSRKAEQAEIIQRKRAEAALSEAQKQEQAAQENARRARDNEEKAVDAAQEANEQRLNAIQAAQEANEQRLNAKLAATKTLLASGYTFDALVSAMAIAQEVQQNSSASSTDLMKLAAVLHKAVYFEGFTEQNQLNGHSQWVEDVVFHPNGDNVISSSADQTIRIWDKAGNELAQLTGHRANIRDLNISYDGEILASASTDGAIRLWDISDLSNHQVLRELNHFSGINDIVFNHQSHHDTDNSADEKELDTIADDRLLAYSDGNGNIVLWNVSNLLASSIEIAPRNGEMSTASDLCDFEVRPKCKEYYYALETFTGQQDQIVNLELESEDFDTFLYLLGPDGEVVAENDDRSLGTLNSALSIPLPRDGEYKIIVTSYAAGEAGSYSLRGYIDTPLAVLRTNSQSPVNGISFSPNNELLATANANGKVNVWDIEKKQLLAELEGHPSYINSVSFDPTGNLLASGDADGNLLLWRLQDILADATRASAPTSENSRFIYDGEPIELSAEDDVWPERNTFYEVRTFEGRTGEEVLIRLETANSNSAYSQSGSLDTYLILEDERGQMVAENDDSFGTLDSTLALVIPQDGTYRLIITTYTQEDIAEDEVANAFLTVSRPLPVAFIKAHSGPINHVEFNNSGNTITTASADGTIKLWDYYGRPLQTLLGHNSAVNQVSFSNDDNFFATAGDRTVRFWKLNNSSRQLLNPNSELLDEVDVGNDIFAGRSYSNRVLLWSEDGLETSDFLGDEGFCSRSNIEFSPDGHFLIFGGFICNNADQDFGHDLMILDIENRRLSRWPGHDSPISSVAFSPVKSLIASGDFSGRILVRDLEGKILYDSQDFSSVRPNEDTPIYSGNRGIVSLAFSRDARFLASSSSESTSFDLWTLGENSFPYRNVPAHSGSINRVIFHPVQDYLVSISDDNTAKVWRYSEEQVVREAILEGHLARVSDAVFSQDGNLLITSSGDASIRFWDWKEEAIVEILEGHKDQIEDISVSPSGNFLLSAGGDGTLSWNFNLDDLLAKSCDLLTDFMANPNTSTQEKALCDGRP